MTITIKRANDKEVKILLQLWIDKAKWLEEQGKRLWGTDQFTEEKIKSKYDDPEYYICYDNQNVVGGFILIEYDRKYWPDKRDDNALYLHKLLVCNGFNGKGYSKMILDWLKEFGLGMGKDFIRLDYDNQRPAIQKLYTDNGFVVVENLVNEDGKSMAKAEFLIRTGDTRTAPRAH
jgi:hypothetical protein